MPALARADINTATEKATTELQGEIKNAVIAEISVTARIDYILRFSKQAVLVVAEQVDQYSAIARQFLVTLSSDNANEASSQNNANKNQSNVAFVSASVKLNDIQIRCRLIEQLFSNTLFDPEQSLVVSVLRLAKQQGEAITIVVEHAHGLSLQIKYELSQLVAIAKQNKQVVNVVMFAQPKAADEIGQNKSIFKNKLTIIDAISGQLYSNQSTKKVSNDNEKWLQPWQKIVLFTVFFLMIFVSIVLFYYLQTEQGSKYLQQPSIAKNKGTFVGNKSISINEKSGEIQALASKPNGQIVLSANVQEINLALLNPIPVVKNESVPAKTNDVLSALLSKNINVIKTKPVEYSNSEVSVIESSEQSVMHVLDTDYYFEMMEEFDGVVVQIAGFSDSQHWQDFLSLYPEQEFYSYQKVFSDNIFTVITSKVYPNRLAAKEAMKTLPEAIIQRDLWLKPISTVIAEINTFKE